MIPLSTLAVVAALGGLLSVVALWVINYRSTEDAPKATSRTTETVVGVLSAAVFSIVVAVSEFTGLIGTVGDVVATSPAGVGQAVLGFLAIAGFGGWLEIGVVGGTMIVVAVLGITTAVRN
ncbi:hypothetical protein [Halolamina salina]|uniref:Integral membrane protein n=1 Tax=Halolamina salina TaxID=1220023 RepID=A0ABD6BAQ2_9EURY